MVPSIERSRGKADRRAPTDAPVPDAALETAATVPPYPVPRYESGVAGATIESPTSYY